MAEHGTKYGGIEIDVPPGFKKFHELIGQLTMKHDLARVFEDWLEYIVMGYTADKSMTWDKNYTKDEIQVLYEMYREFILFMNKKLETVNWFDFPGTYYEACVGTPYQREKAGQFFTPQNVCTAMAKMNISTVQKKGPLKMNDPSAGSGRCLLAAHIERPGSYMVAEDIDRTCCLMATVNFLIHGVVGEVIWHNSLLMDFYGAWKVNETLNLIGIPHIRSLSEEEYKASCVHQKPKEVDVATSQVEIVKPTKQTTLGGLFE